MKKILILVAATTLLFLSPVLVADQFDCEVGFRAYFEPPKGLLAQIQLNLRKILKKKVWGKTDAEKVEEYIWEFRKQREEYAQKKYDDVRRNNPDEVPDIEAYRKEFLEQLALEIVFDGRNPAKELAYGAMKSDIFEGMLHIYNELYGGFNYKMYFKVLGRLRDLGHEVNTLGKEKRTNVTFNRSRMTLFFEILTLGLMPNRTTGVVPKSVEIPLGKFLDVADFHTYLMEISEAMFISMNPEPSFSWTWMKAMYNKADHWQLKKDPTLEYEALSYFKDVALGSWRRNYQKFLEGVSLELIGEANPELIQEMYQRGLSDTIVKHVVDATYGAAKRLGLKIQKGWTKKSLKAFREAIQKDPEYIKYLENLSLNVNYYMRPVIVALSVLYVSSVVDGGPQQVIDNPKMVLKFLAYEYDRYVNGHDELEELKKKQEKMDDYFFAERESKYDLALNKNYKEEVRVRDGLLQRKAEIEANIAAAEEKLNDKKTSPGDKEKLKKQINLYKKGPRGLEVYKEQIQKRDEQIRIYEEEAVKKNLKKTK